MKNLLTVLIIAVFATQAAATMYWCKENGKTVISNVPCQNVVQEREFKQTAPTTKKQLPTTTYNLKTTNTRKAKTLTKRKKYTTTHRVSERNGKVEVSGRIKGPSCSSIRIHVFARSNDGRIIECVDMAKLSGNSTIFKCSDDVRRFNDGRPRDWFVSSIYTECQE